MTATGTTATSTLLQLPGELRNTIYRYALTTQQDMEIDKNITTRLALLATCKQMREEASPIFYAGNTFKITCKVQWYSSMEMAKLWLEKIGTNVLIIETLRMDIGFSTTQESRIRSRRKGLAQNDRFLVGSGTRQVLHDPRGGIIVCMPAMKAALATFMEVKLRPGVLMLGQANLMDEDRGYDDFESATLDKVLQDLRDAVGI